MGFVPIVGSSMDIYEGAKYRNYTQLVLGAATLAAECASGGRCGFIIFVLLLT